MAKHHYVYALTDPRSFGQPFYIGKGSGDRKVQHFRNVPKVLEGKPGSDKYGIIQDIKDAGLSAGCIILSHHDDEEDALTAERVAINDVGLDKLTNKSIGGEGVKANKSKGDQKLTAKQEKFCNNIAGGTYASATDAWRDAYPGSKATKKTQNEAATRELKKPKINARIEELRAPVIEKTRYDLDWCLGRQEDAANLAEETGNAGAMSGAVREIGKLVAAYPAEKSDVTISGGEIALRLQRGRARVAEERDK